MTDTTIRRYTSEEEGDEESRADETQGEQVVCPECSGNLVSDGERGETVCEDCGLVVDEDEIDPGPEWRAFDAAEKDQKSRVGAPTTNMMHDKGAVDQHRLAGQGRLRQLPVPAAAREDAAPPYLERAVPHPGLQGAQPQAGARRDRPHGQRPRPAENVRETASVIYRRALDDDLLPGRSIEGVATASLYAAARQAGTPRSLDELTAVSRVEKDDRPHVPVRHPRTRPGDPARGPGELRSPLRQRPGPLRGSGAPGSTNFLQNAKAEGSIPGSPRRTRRRSGVRRVVAHQREGDPEPGQ